MFVTATFRGQTKEMHTAVPASAILHMHDRDYVYVPAPDNKFRRVEVVSGDFLPDNMQEVKSGLNRASRWCRTRWFWSTRSINEPSMKIARRTK